MIDRNHHPLIRENNLLTENTIIRLMSQMLFHDLLVNLLRPIKDNVYYFLEQKQYLEY